MNDIVEVEMELRGRECLAVADVWWRWDDFECTSTYGDDKSCTEKWKEIHIEDMKIKSVDIYTDSGEYRDVPLNALTEKDKQCIYETVGAQLIESEI